MAPTILPLPYLNDNFVHAPQEAGTDIIPYFGHLFKPTTASTANHTLFPATEQVQEKFNYALCMSCSTCHVHSYKITSSVMHAGCVDDVLGGCGFINGQQVSVNDDNSHGTHVAGTIGATKNGAGVLGVAQKVSLMSCKFLDAAGDGYNSDAIACINYCAANFKRMGQTVPIYSNSWGCLNCYDPTVYNAIANTAGKMEGPSLLCSKRL